MTNEYTEASMTQELRKLAERLSPDRTTVLRIDAEQAGEAILSLLDRLEKADALVKAIKTDLHDWEDWPGDSREEFRAMEASK